MNAFCLRWFMLTPLFHSQMVKAFGRPSKQRARRTDLDQMLAEAKDEDDAIMLEEDNEEQEVQEEKVEEEEKVEKEQVEEEEKVEEEKSGDVWGCQGMGERMGEEEREGPTAKVEHGEEKVEEEKVEKEESDQEEEEEEEKEENKES